MCSRCGKHRAAYQSRKNLYLLEPPSIHRPSSEKPGIEPPTESLRGKSLIPYARWSYGGFRTFAPAKFPMTQCSSAELAGTGSLVADRPPCINTQLRLPLHSTSAASKHASNGAWHLPSHILARLVQSPCLTRAVSCSQDTAAAPQERQRAGRLAAEHQHWQNTV